MRIRYKIEDNAKDEFFGRCSKCNRPAFLAKVIDMKTGENILRCSGCIRGLHDSNSKKVAHRLSYKNIQRKKKELQ